MPAVPPRPADGLTRPATMSTALPMSRADGRACATPVLYVVMTTGPSRHPAGTSNPARTAVGSAGPHPQAGPTPAGQPSTPTDDQAACRHDPLTDLSPSAERRAQTRTSRSSPKAARLNVGW